MDAIADILDDTQKDNRSLVYVRGKNKGGANRPTPHDTPRQVAVKLLENGEVTHRDAKILYTLLGIGVATRHQLQRLFWQEAVLLTTVLVRLRLLEQKGLLCASKQYIPHLKETGLTPCKVYGLGEAGLEVLAIRNALSSRREVPYNSDYYSLLQDNRLFLHHIQASELYTCLKLESRQREHMLKWLNETAVSVRDSSGRELVRPDGAAVIETDKRMAGFFVEIDRHKTDWYKKVYAYERGFRDGDWPARFDGVQKYPIVLCVVPTRHAVKRIAHLISDYQGMGGVTYLFKAWPDILSTTAYAGWYDAVNQRLLDDLTDIDQ